MAFCSRAVSCPPITGSSQVPAPPASIQAALAFRGRYEHLSECGSNLPEKCSVRFYSDVKKGLDVYPQEEDTFSLCSTNINSQTPSIESLPSLPDDTPLNETSLEEFSCGDIPPGHTKTAVLSSPDLKVDCTSQPITSFGERCMHVKQPKKISLLERRGLKSTALQVDCSKRPVLDMTATDSCPGSSGCPESSAYSRQSWDEYVKGEVIGRGAIGLVHSATRKTDSKQVAIKTMSSRDPEILLAAMQEFSILRSITHPFIVQAIDIFITPTCVELVFEYFPGEDLEKAVKTTREHGFAEDVARPLFKQLLLALAHLHANSIMHRDVKAQNILVSKNLQDLRLLDFNSARRLDLEMYGITPTATCMYAAPEIVTGDIASMSSDVWSAGLCCYFMLAGKLPTKRGGDLPSILLRKEAMIGNVKHSCSQLLQVSEVLKSVLMRCLALNQTERPSADEVLREDYFRSAVEVISPAF